MTTSKHNSTALIVLGMHRSGTSMTTGLLKSAGVHLGQALLKAQADNVKGFYENSAVVDADEALLRDMNYLWDDIRFLPDHWWEQPICQTYESKMRDILRDEFGESPLWGLKDPRMCLLLPFWRNLLNTYTNDVRYIIVVRSLEAIAQSLKKRNGFSFEKSGLLWLQHYLTAEYWTRGCHRIFVQYDNILHHPAEFLRSLDIQWPVDDNVIQQRINEFIDPSLRHWKSSNEKSDFGRFQESVNTCRTMFQKGVSESDHKTLDQIKIHLSKQIDALDQLPIGHIEHSMTRYGQIYTLLEERTQWTTQLEQQLAATAKKNQELEQQLVELGTENEQLKEHWNNVKRSMSWKITRPLRWIANNLIHR